MTYESAGILAFIVLSIIDQDVLWRRKREFTRTEHAYRRFLFSILVYYITDALWGFLNDAHLIGALFLDTTVYFVAMGAVVLLWTQYVTAYLETEGIAETALLYIGRALFVLGLAGVTMNFFMPVFFWFDETGMYHAGAARNVYLGIQIVMFILTSIYTLRSTLRASGSMRVRYFAIGFFGVSMTVLIAIQFFFPLLPLYAIGCMVGTCVLHAFVVEGEKEEHRQMLEETLAREREQEQQLSSARRLAYTDPLTNVKSRHAYIETEALLNRRIADGTSGEFAIVVCDLNGLKRVNDSMGHEAGDRYIIESCKLICDQFKHSPVYRVGGDEFVVVLEGADYQMRARLVDSFNQLVDASQLAGGPVVAIGMSEFDPNTDASCWMVLERADSEMYQRKGALKEKLAVGK